MPNVCNIDGQIVAEADATVPVLDRGFLFGDSVYEVFRTRGGIPFAWREHLQRLRASAAAIEMPIDRDDADLMRAVLEALGASRPDGDGERYVRLIVTRGTGSAPSIDLDSAAGPPRLVVLVRDLPVEKVGRPTHAALVDRSPAPGRETDPTVKSGNYVTNVVGLVHARRRGAEECIFVDRSGFATEASTANLYAVFGGALHTPPPGAGLLAGITRRLLLLCARSTGFEVVERRLPRSELVEADEIFLSGTVRDLAPVVRLDDRQVGDGTAGPVTCRLQAAFADYCVAKARDDADALRALGVIGD